MLLGFLFSLLTTQGGPGTVDKIADSGRALVVAESPDARVSPPLALSPGAPPILSFRLYEGKLHGRYDQTNLMLDDAGH